ncbi:MAG: YgfZ/GcvT domain-containing protein, partial [Thermoanaerobaculia bacterium]
GLTAAAHYGDVAAEYRLLRQSCGLVDRLWVEHLELAGEDRARFLNGLVTGDAKALEPGGGLYAFFTSAQGRILAEARIQALAESLLLELPAGCAESIAEHLSHYVVADRVELAPRPEIRALSLVGPDAERVAARLAPDDPPLGDRWSQRRLEWEGAELILAREERLGGPALTLRVATDAAPALAAELQRSEEGQAAEPAGFAAAEALRVEAGCARFGPDFGPERFPQEVGETDALDFDKGCYLGQEVVARIHYRGKVNYRLCGLRLGSSELPAPGSAVDLAGAEVGRSGSAVASPSLQQGIALAVLHRKAELGATVGIAGVAAEVVDLPFVTV